MKCFTICFRTLKPSKTQKPNSRIALKDLIHENCEVVQDIKQPRDEMQLAELIKIVEDSKNENENQLNTSSRKKFTFDFDVKATTFDFDVKANEECKTQEAADCLVENGKEKSETDTFSDSITSSSGFISLPISNRYHNCRKNSDSECEEIQLNESDLDDGCVDSGFVEEESSESLFSISLDSKKQVVSAAEMGDKEVNSPLKPRVREMQSKELNITASTKSEYVDSVLKPVKNLSQRKAGEAKVALVHNEGKENINFDQNIVIPFSAEPKFKQIVKKQVCEQQNVKENEDAVDTSLSSWLAKNGADSVCNSSESTMSSKRVQERSILGALNVDPIGELSKSTSSRQSPGQSQDDVPIIGTVGSYWRHAGRQVAGSGSSSACRGDSGVTSKCIEMGEVTSQSTPFQTRLEKALISGVV